MSTPNASFSRSKNLTKPYLRDRTECDRESAFGEFYYFILKSKFEGDEENRGLKDQNIHVFLVTVTSFLRGGFNCFQSKRLPREYKILQVYESCH